MMRMAPKPASVVIRRGPKSRNDETFFMVEQPEKILARERQANHAAMERQAKWSRRQEILFCKNVDADWPDILKVFSAKSLFRHASGTRRG